MPGSRKPAPSLADFGDLVYRSKWWLLLIGAAAILVTYAFNVRSPGAREATATLDLGGSSLEPYIATQIETLQSVSEQAGLDPGALRVHRLGNTSLVEISYRGNSEQQASNAVNAIAESYIELLRRNQENARFAASRLSDAELEDLRQKMLRSETDLRVAEAAHRSRSDLDALRRRFDDDRAMYETLRRRLNEVRIEARVLEPVSSRVVDVQPGGPRPNVRRNCFLAWMTATAAGLGFLSAGRGMKVRLRGLAGIEAASQSRVLAALPRVGGWQAKPSLIYTGQNAIPGEMPYGEALEKLRDAVLTRTGSVLVASPAASEGRTSTAANLAVSVAAIGKRVLLIDGDLSRPALHGMFLQNSARSGLAEVIRGKAGWRDVAVRHASYPGLDLIPAGDATGIPGEFDLSATLRDAAREYDLTIVDSAPLLTNPASIDLARAADQVMLVVRAGETTSESLQDALGYLHRIHAPLFGIVANDLGFRME